MYNQNKLIINNRLVFSSMGRSLIQLLTSYLTPKDYIPAEFEKPDLTARDQNVFIFANDDFSVDCEGETRRRLQAAEKIRSVVVAIDSSTFTHLRMHFLDAPSVMVVYASSAADIIKLVMHAKCEAQSKTRPPRPVQTLSAALQLPVKQRHDRLFLARILKWSSASVALEYGISESEISRIKNVLFPFHF